MAEVVLRTLADGLCDVRCFLGKTGLTLRARCDEDSSASGFHLPPISSHPLSQRRIDEQSSCQGTTSYSLSTPLRATQACQATTTVAQLGNNMLGFSSMTAGQIRSDQKYELVDMSPCLSPILLLGAVAFPLLNPQEKNTNPHVMVRLRW